MKWKADYSKKYSWVDVFTSDINQRWVKFPMHEKIDNNTISVFDERLVYKIDFHRQLYQGGLFLDTTPYQRLLSSDWYKVSEVKEEPKKDRTIMQSIIEDHKEAQRGVSDMLAIELEKKRIEGIRSICREEIKNDKMTSLGHKMVSDNLYIKKSMFTNNPKFMKDWISGSWNIDEDIKKPLKKPKKPKQEFDNSNRVMINMEGDMLFKYNDKTKSIPHKYATQSEINQFFKGSKKRKRNLDEYYFDIKTGNWCPKLHRKEKQYIYYKEAEKGTLSGKLYNVKYYKTLDVKDKGVEITEAEYLKGIK